MLLQARIGVVITEFLNMPFIELHNDRKTLSGTMGKLMHPFLVHLFKNLTYVPVIGLGIRYPNNSYDGALKLMQENKLDIYFKAEPLGLVTDFAIHTRAFSATQIHTGHYIYKRVKDSNLAQVFTNFPLQIWMFYWTAAFALLAIMLIKMLYQKFTLPQIRSMLITYGGIFIRQTPHRNSPATLVAPYLTLTAVIAIFILNFLFETLIKTDIVVLDTSNLINTVEEALKSPRIIGWGIEERVNQEFSLAHQGSWQRRIWDKPKVMVEKTPRGMKKIMDKAHQLLAIQDIVYLQILFLSGCIQINYSPFWTSTKPLLELVETIYIRKQFIRDYMVVTGKSDVVYDYIQTGLYSHYKMEGATRFTTNQVRLSCIYNDYERYKEQERPSQKSLKVSNFSVVLIALLGMFSLASLLCIADHIANMRR